MEVNIGGAFSSIVTEINSAEVSKVDDCDIYGICPSEKSKSNLAPRLRMAALYTIAQTLGYLVIGTGNFSESMIGWTTKFGDSASDFNPIKYLTKTEVCEIGSILAEEYGLDKKYITKAPSDGLTNKTDEDNFGFTYDELDDYLLTGKSGSNVHKIQELINWAKHKRNMPLGPGDKFFF